MRDPDTVGMLIERIVARARIPGRAQRDDLRRELWTHFEEASGSADSTREAIRRFGAETMIGESFMDSSVMREEATPTMFISSVRAAGFVA